MSVRGRLGSGCLVVAISRSQQRSRRINMPGRTAAAGPPRCCQGVLARPAAPAAPPVISTPMVIAIRRPALRPSSGRALSRRREARVVPSEGRRARHSVAALYRLLVAHLTPQVGAQEKRHTSSGVSRAFLAFVAQSSGTPTPCRACAARGHNMADPPPSSRGPDRLEPLPSLIR